MLAVAENIDDVLEVSRGPDGNSQVRWREASEGPEVGAELAGAIMGSEA
jgi:hypothetical protein